MKLIHISIVLLCIQTIYSAVYNNICTISECGNKLQDIMKCQMPYSRKLGKIYFFENWQSIKLQTSENFPLENFGYEDKAYTHQFPEGWELDNTGTTEDGGCEEYKGWSVFNRYWWIKSGYSRNKKGREEIFKKSECEQIVVVDANNHNCNKNEELEINSSLITPEINIVGHRRDLFLIIETSWWSFTNSWSAIDIAFDGSNDWKRVQYNSSNPYSKYFVYGYDQKTQTIAIPAHSHNKTVRIKFTYHDQDSGRWFALGQLGIVSLRCPKGKVGKPGTIQCVPPTEVIDECAYVTNECNFQGERKYICKTKDNVILYESFDIKSVYIPPEKKLMFWQINQSFHAETDLYESIKCFDDEKRILSKQKLKRSINRKEVQKNGIKYKMMGVKMHHAI